MLQAIVFDFDGVIANSEPLHFTAFRDVLAEVGVVLTQEDYDDRYLGYDDTGVFKAIAIRNRRPWGASELASLAERKAVRFEELERGGSILFTGAADAIRRAAAAAPIAIASGALRREITRVLAREGLADLFAAIVGADDTPASKPAPDPYLLAMARLSEVVGAPLRARDCVAVEDSRWGLESARAAGLRTVAVAQTYNLGHSLDGDLIIPTIAALDIAALCSLVSNSEV